VLDGCDAAIGEQAGEFTGPGVGKKVVQAQRASAAQTEFTRQAHRQERMTARFGDVDARVDGLGAEDGRQASLPGRGLVLDVLGFWPVRRECVPAAWGVALTSRDRLEPRPRTPP